ncbi:MAG TPA: hypothetical protein VI756_33070 [Blastocatellia bacterium]
MKDQKEYGELMSYLLHWRERFASDAEFNRFVVESLRALVYDLRDFEVYISISPESLKWSHGIPKEMTKARAC